jgi:hypothetical protein
MTNLMVGGGGAYHSFSVIFKQPHGNGLFRPDLLYEGVLGKKGVCLKE